MTTLETLKWDGKKAGKIAMDLKVAKETSSADLIHRAVLRANLLSFRFISKL